MQPRLVYAWHALIVAPVLLLIAYRGVKGTLNTVAPAVFWAIGVAAAAALFYHGSRLVSTPSKH